MPRHVVAYHVMTEIYWFQDLNVWSNKNHLGGKAHVAMAFLGWMLSKNRSSEK